MAGSNIFLVSVIPFSGAIISIRVFIYYEKDVAKLDELLERSKTEKTDLHIQPGHLLQHCQESLQQSITGNQEQLTKCLMD